MKIYIYQIWFPTSNKSYIGQTDDLKKRMSEHLNFASLVGNALRKYDDWQICVLHTCNSRADANRLEIDHIRNFDSVAPNGYNLTAGGDGCIGYKHTDEAKEKIRQSNLNRISTNKGFKHTEEWRREKSKSMQGNKNALGHKKSSLFRAKYLKTRIKTLEDNQCK